MSRFVGELKVRLVEDSAAGLFELLEPFGYAYGRGRKLQRIWVPKGYKTDFCSVPRIPFAFWLLGDRARKAGVVHDWLYTGHQVDRATADRLLRQMVQLEGVGVVGAWAFWLAVRIGGRWHW